LDNGSGHFQTLHESHPFEIGAPASAALPPSVECFSIFPNLLKYWRTGLDENGHWKINRLAGGIGVPRLA
jgi:hypothetical protein